MEALKLPKEIYTIEDILALPEGKRAELLDGKIYYMASPSEMHQRILGELFLTIGNHIKRKGGPCRVYPAPFAVYLNDDRDYLEPDVVVVCDPGKLKEDGCHGAPDWVLEIVSPSSASLDYIRKAATYAEAGIREYWIVDPHKKTINVYNFGDEVYSPTQHRFDEQVKVGIYEDLVIDFAQILRL
ncbi:MAG: Uma2 family endonuclease [Lachnospiraceae bacterium]|jgi:Uma2 family endonuclease|nr:Uma2 family endonuclease [Lachnospiraceae bacterium]